MTAKILPLLRGAVSPDVERELHAFDKALQIAIDRAREGMVPQGLIVALLQGYATQQTMEMMK